MERGEQLEYVPRETYTRMLDGEITAQEYVEAMRTYVDKRLQADSDRRMELLDDIASRPRIITRIGRSVLGALTK